MSGAAGRPRRAARPNQKYVLDPFENIRDLIVESSGSDTTVDDDVPSDDEFDEQKAQAAAEEEAEEEAEIDDEEDQEPTSSGAENESEADVPDETSNTKVKRKNVPLSERVQFLSKRRKSRPMQSTSNHFPIFNPLGASEAKGRAFVYNRGLPELSNNQGKELRLLYHIGPAEEDLIANIQARERWINDVTLPYRKQNERSWGGGLAYSPFYPREKRVKEANEAWDWYYAKGGDHEVERQVLTRSEMEANWCRGDGMVVGPIGSQKIFDGIVPLDSWNMGDAWTEDQRVADHQSWIINAGEVIQCLEWAPNQGGGSQFLAIATTSASSQHSGIETLAPAYNARVSTVHCLQIWELFAEGNEGEEGSRIDYSKKPRLRCVISSDWGHIRRMSWCPTPDRPTADNKRPGLLATIFGDGKLRVFEIHRPDDNVTDITSYIHIQQVAFEFKPPDVLCTCLTWLSSTDIAAGTTAGSVAIWSLRDVMAQDKVEGESPEPWFYHLLHHSYIIDITSGYPSRPHILITFSLDGHTRATDLRSPTQDTVTSTRTRVSQGPIVWHDITQTALSADDNFTLRAYSLRSFHKTTSLGRFTASACDVATSPLHATVLVGCADGTVYVTNPMRRLREHKVRPWTQCVMKHDWRRPVTKGQPQSEDTEMQDTQSFLAKAAIRITTGYKLTLSELGQATLKNTTKDMVPFATVYEEKTAMRQVCWNPNIRAGTWAAMGAGSGLVFVKDLGAD